MVFYPLLKFMDHSPSYLLDVQTKFLTKTSWSAFSWTSSTPRPSRSVRCWSDEPRERWQCHGSPSRPPCYIFWTFSQMMMQQFCRFQGSILEDCFGLSLFRKHGTSLGRKAKRRHPLGIRTLPFWNSIASRRLKGSEPSRRPWILHGASQRSATFFIFLLDDADKVISNFLSIGSQICMAPFSFRSSLLTSWLTTIGATFLGSRRVSFGSPLSWIIRLLHCLEALLARPGHVLVAELCLRTKAPSVPGPALCGRWKKSGGLSRCLCVSYSKLPLATFWWDFNLWLWLRSHALVASLPWNIQQNLLTQRRLQYGAPRSCSCCLRFLSVRPSHWHKACGAPSRLNRRP